MIHRIGEEWEGLARTLPQMDDGRNPAEFSRMLSTVQQVREALRAMCRVSVTRSTVRDAVRDALQSVLEQMGPDVLFPGISAEIESLRARVDAALDARTASVADLSGSAGAVAPSGQEEAVAAEIERRLSSFEDRIRGVEGEVGEAHFRITEEVAQRGTAEAQWSDSTDGLRRESALGQEALGALGAELGALGLRLREELDAQRQDGVSRVEGLEASLRQLLEERSLALEASLRTETRENLDSTLSTALAATLATAEEKIEAVKAGMEAWIGRLEESFPKSIEGATADVQRRLREEMDAMAQDLSARLGEIQSVLGRLESTAPRRDDVTAVETRLARLESLLGEYSSRFDTLDGVGSELSDVARRLGDVQAVLTAVSSRVEQSGQDVGSLQGAVSSGLVDLRSLLETGIQRWESDQSIMLERVSSIRDSLRDQLRSVGERVEDSAEGLWGKLRRKEGGLRLSREEWDRVSSKLEGIISGLESVLARKKAQGSS